MPDRIAVRIDSECRAGDAIVHWKNGRLLVVLPGASRREAAQFADAIHTAVSNDPFEITEGLSVDLEAAIGIAGVDPGEACSAEVLIERATRALERAKREQAACIVFEAVAL